MNKSRKGYYSYLFHSLINAPGTESMSLCKIFKKMKHRRVDFIQTGKMIFVHLVALFLYPSLSPPRSLSMFQPSISSLPVFFSLSSLISAVFDNTSIQSVSLSWRPVKCSCKPSHQSNQATKLRTAVSISILLHVLYVSDLTRLEKQKFPTGNYCAFRPSCLTQTR